MRCLENYWDKIYDFEGYNTIIRDFSQDFLQNTSFAEKYKNNIYRNKFYEFVQDPTRVVFNFSNLIDYVITNKSYLN